MDYQELSGATTSERDKAFALEFANFVNGGMSSADQTGREMTRAHRYLQQQMFKVFIGFMRQLAYNYQKGRYDQRNEWASKLASEAYGHLVECELIYDPVFTNLNVDCYGRERFSGIRTAMRADNPVARLSSWYDSSQNCKRFYRAVQ